MPDGFVQISKEDAAKRGFKSGDLVDVRSRRGAVRLKTKVGGIGEGRVFIPSHFGAIESPGRIAQAANELTQ